MLGILRVVLEELILTLVRWDQILLGTSEMPPENVLGGLYRNRSHCSEQLQTVFAMYNQELSRDRVAPSYQTLRRMVRPHIDQTIRTRHFKARNERIQTGIGRESEREERQRGKKVGAIQPLIIPSPREMLSRDSELPHDTRNNMGTSGNVFESPTCSKRTTLRSLRKTKEFGIIFSRIET